MAICKLCHHENPDGVQFCANCGNALETVSVSTSSEHSDSEAVETLVPVAAPGQQAFSSQGQGSGAAETQPAARPYVAAQGPNSQYYEPANTVPFNTKDQQAYQQQLLRGDRPDYENVCVLALVFGILGFFFNPLYLCSVAAIVLGIIGHVNNGSKKSLALGGWILGICSFAVQLVVDFVCVAATCGIGRIAFCF